MIQIFPIGLRLEWRYLQREVKESVRFDQSESEVLPFHISFSDYPVFHAAAEVQYLVGKFEIIVRFFLDFPYLQWIRSTKQAPANDSKDDFRRTYRIHHLDSLTVLSIEMLY